MHVPPSKLEEWTTKIEQLKTKFANIILFKNPMDSQTISIAGSNDN
jgi:hypothetical protein